MKKFLLLLFFICFGVLPVFCAPMNTNKMIKVGISDNAFQRYYYTENVFYATKKLFIEDEKTKQILKEIAANTNIKVSIKNNLFNIYENEKLLLSNLETPLNLKTEENGLLGIYNLKRAGKPALYRGYFEILKPQCKENMFLINNVLPLETYLLGVVPNEMPIRFGLEALKAQAIAARNYALRPRDKKYHEFDICDSVSCQVYFGANTEMPLATQAVEETKGMILQYEDEIIIALYSSTAGGYTESYENAFLITMPEYPYLSAISDNKKISSLEKEKDAAAFYKSEPETFDNNSPYFRWTREWTKEELQNVLKEGLKAAYNTGFCYPELKKVEDFGELKKINVLKRGKSGKIISMEIITDKERYIVEKELVIRRLFKEKGKALPSANVIFEEEYNDKNELIRIKAYGGGYGHGVGLSQHGAGFMAKEKKTFDEILQHYYKDTKIMLIPVELSSELEKNAVIYEFFVKEKKAKIIIENKLTYNELKVVINGKEFNLKAQPSLSRKYEIDISQYLNIGENKVYFFYSLDNNKNKTIKVQIELYGKKKNE